MQNFTYSDCMNGDLSELQGCLTKKKSCHALCPINGPCINNCVNSKLQLRIPNTNKNNDNIAPLVNYVSYF